MFMARYIKQEMADLRGDGKQRNYYRMKVERNIGTKELIRHMTHPGSGLSRAMVVHVMEALAEQLAMDLAEGYSVSVDGIGTFTATVGVEDKSPRADEDGEAKRNARSLTVTGVNCRADKQLVKEVALRCKLKKWGESRIRRSAYSKEQRLGLAVAYLADLAHPVMRLDDYVRLTGVSRSTASRELKEFTRGADSPIGCIGRGSALVFVRKDKAAVEE